jgi:hypothetical protein
VKLSLLFLVLTAHAGAVTSSDIEKSCIAQKKSKPVCACISRNVEKRLGKQLLTEEQLEKLNAAMNAAPQKAEETPEPNPMEDYLTGLESHCQGKSSYSGE